MNINRSKLVGSILIIGFCIGLVLYCSASDPVKFCVPVGIITFLALVQVFTYIYSSELNRNG